jgi:glycopeptide antibiotics resistance protein
LIYAAFVVYGSLVPLNYRPLAWSEAQERFASIPYLDLGVESRADWIANILLFVPLSFLGMATLAADQGKLGTLIASLVVLVGASTLSLAIEFTQIFFPPRTVSINDLVAESSGAVVGVIGWWTMGQPAVQWLRRVWMGQMGRGLAATLLPAYLLILLVIHIMPGDIISSPAELYKKLRDGRVLWIPFSAHYASPFDVFQELFWNTVYFAPVGWLWAQLPRQARSFRREFWETVLVGLVIVAGLELAQLFIYSRVADVTDLFTCTIAVVAGWALARAVSPRAASDSPALSSPTSTGRYFAWQDALAVAALAGWVGVLLVFYWYPFDFDADPHRVADVIQHTSLLPFADYYRQSEYKSFDQALHKSLLFLPVGVLLGMISWVREFRAVRWLAFLLGCGLAAAVEAGQLFLPTRFPGVTDIIIGSLGVGAGLALARWSGRLQTPMGQVARS